MNLAENGYSTPYRDDEIDLFDLAGKLFKQKRLILSITAFIAIAAVVIALILPKSYTTEAILNTPNTSSLDAWNSRISLIQRIAERPDEEHSQIAKLFISRENSYTDFQRFLTSPATKRSAFEQSELYAAPADNGDSASQQVIEGRYNEFLKKLSISTEKKGTRTTVSYSSTNPEESARVISSLLIPYAQNQYISSLKDSYTSALSTVKKQLLTEIKRKETEFKSENLQRLTELRAALKEAEAGGIKDLRTSEITPTVLDNASYLLGTKILKSRIETINHRLDQYRFYTKDAATDTSQKPYISGVDTLAFQLKQLDLLTVDFASIQPYTLEQAAPIPVSPSKPKKTLIVAIGLILGLMLGVFAALLKIAIQGRKEKLEHAGQMQKLMADPA